MTLRLVTAPPQGPVVKKQSAFPKISEIAPSKQMITKVKSLKATTDHKKVNKIISYQLLLDRQENHAEGGIENKDAQSKERPRQ